MFNPILIAAAVIPAVIILILVYKSDKLEKEPKGLIISLVLMGAASTLAAGFAETVFEGLLGAVLPENSVAYNVVLYFIIVAFAEEGFKYLLLSLRTWKSPYFNCQFDGVVYAVSVSIGFALWENIQYVLAYGFSTALVRAVTAVPGHACFGVFMGVFYGLAKRSQEMGNTGESRVYRTLSLIIPALLHGLYDFIATYEEYGLGLFFLLFVAAVFVASIILVRKMSKNDKYFNAPPENLYGTFPGWYDVRK